MTISSVTEMWSRKGGYTESTLGQSYAAVRTRAFQVEHTANETHDNIENANDGTTAIPALDTEFAANTGILCTRRTVETAGPVFSIVVCEYSGEANAQGSGEPVDFAPKIRYRAISKTEATDTDINGFPYTTSIGETVSGLTEDVWDYECVIERNFLFFSPYNLRLYNRSYSSDAFPPGSG